MTAPWADAHVDVELDYSNVDRELALRLTASINSAARAARQAFSRMERDAQRNADRMANNFERAFTRIEQRAAQLRQSLRDLSVNLIVSESGAMESLRRVHARMQGWLNVNPLVVRVDVDTSGMGRLRQEVNQIGRATRSSGRGGMFGSLARSIAGLGGSALSAVGTVGKFAAIAGLATVAVGGMVPAVAALGAALTSAAVAGGGLFIAGMGGVMASVATLKTAFLGVGDALKVAFDPEKAEEFNEALAKLAPNARSSVLAMQDLGKQFQAVVGTKVQDTFFAGLAPQISQLSGYLQSVKTAMVGVAQGFNDGARAALGFLNSTRGVGVVSTLLNSMSQIGANFGRTLGNLVPGLLAVGAGAGQAFAPLSQGLAGAAQSLSDFLVKAQESGQIAGFFQSAIGVARQLGGVLAEVGGILGGVFRAASAAGGGNFLGGLTQSLATVNSWVNGPGGAALTSFFQSMQAGLGAVLPILMQLAGIIGGTVAPAIAGLLVQVGPSISQLVGMLGQGLQALQPAMGPLGQFINTLAAAIGPLLPIVGQLVTAFVNLAGPVLGSFATALSPILGAIGQGLVAAFQALMPAIQPLQNLLQSQSGLWTQIATVLGQVLAQAISAIVPIFTTLAGVIAQLLPAIQPLIPIIGELLVQAIQLVAPIIQQMATAWAQMVVSLLPLIPPLMQIVQALLPPLIQIIGALLPLVTLAALTFAKLVPAIAPVIVVLAQVLAFVARLSGAFLGFVATVLGAVVGFVTGVVGKFTEMITTVVSAVTGFVSRVVGFFVNLGAQLLGAATTIWTNVSNAFSDGVGKAVGFVAGLKDKVVSALQGAGQWLVDMGKQIIQGLIDGVKSMATSVGNAIKDTVGGAVDAAKSIIPGLAVGGVLPAFARGGALPRLAGGGTSRGGAATQAVKPGGFIVNAAAAARNRRLLRAIAPRGRFLSGPGTRTSDSITGMHNGKPVAALSRSEYYVPPKQAALSMPLLWAINTGRNVASLATGGVLPDQLRNVARGITQSGYVWGGWGNGWNTDCSGAASSLANMATGKANAPGKGQRSATGGFASFLKGLGFKSGMGPAGSLSIGWDAGHAASTLPTGENVEHTGPEGTPGKFGAGAQGADGFPNKAHLPMSDPNLGNGGLSGNGLGGNGLGASTTGGGSTSYGNAGGSSSISSAADADKAGLVPVWVENWPSNLGSGGGTPTLITPGGTPDPSGGLTGAPTRSDVDTIPLKQNPDGTWSSTDPEWDHLMERESGGRADIVQQVQDANSGGNEASGLFQIAKGTWKAYGGTKYAPTAGEATPQQQAEIAAAIFNKEGGRPWGSGLPGRESDEKLRAGIQRAGTGSPTVTPAGVTNTGTDTTGGGLTTTTTNTPAGGVTPEDVTNAEDKLRVAKLKLAEAQNAEVKGETEKARQASRDAKQRRIDAAQRDVDSAQRALDTARSGAQNTTTLGPDATKDQKAQAAIAAAKQREAEATNRVTDAEARLQALRDDPKSKPSQIAAAENAVTRAKQAQAKAAKRTRDLEAKAQKANQQDEKKRELPTIGGGALSGQAGGLVDMLLKENIDTLVNAHPGLLGNYDNSKAKTSLGTRAGAVGNSFLSGQLGSALGVFGLDAQPPVLDAIGQYMSDNTSSGDGDTEGGGVATKKDLVDLVHDLPAIVVNINGNADGDDVVRKIDQSRRRRMRRYVK